MSERAVIVHPPAKWGGRLVGVDGEPASTVRSRRAPTAQGSCEQPAGDGGGVLGPRVWAAGRNRGAGTRPAAEISF